MAGIKLKELGRYRFRHEQTVTIANINPGGHVGNSQMADLVHDGRIMLLKSMGLSEINIGDGRTGLIMTDLIINFKMELFYGDKIVIESDISDIQQKGLRFFHRILKNDKIAALAETGHVTFSYTDRKICEVPVDFIKKINSLN
jgi:acyl-CoA thioesterase FadM